MREGGCFCGEVRYRADGPAKHETHCHCSICRRTSGAPFVSWITVPAAGFRFTKGMPTEFRSSAVGVRFFCPRCGCQLAFRYSEHPELVDVSIGSLDDPEAVTPRDHTQTSSQLSFIELADGLPRFPGGRD